MESKYKLHLGNTKNVLDLMIEKDEKVDMIFTSPPYYAMRKNYSGNSDGEVGAIHVDDYVDWFLEFTERFMKVLKPDGSFFLNINDKIDFMSIDIDGLDVEIFKSINVFLPTVICIEGGQILEPYHSVVANDISANNIQQSLKTMMELFKDKGYKLLCTYQDSFFIKNEYSDLFNVSNDIFDLYIDGLIALPRIPYIKILLDSNKLKNRIIDYIIQFLDIDEIIKIGLNGGTKEKAIWIDHNFHRIKEKLEELKQLQKEYPYDECDETLWIKISET